MRAVDLIRRKRDGGRLADEEIRWLVGGVVSGAVPDYQAAAFLMAAFLRGLDAGELGALTAAMVSSGEVVDLSAIAGPKVDKHSTGGVGDKVSIPLAPMVAACGVYVPMISGRGLGHTGGTLDKLESIPGFRVDLEVPDFARIVGETGLCLIGQTARLAPADRQLYALRDATGTVESIPLISSSIMCKKIAEGIDGLVLDVKVGSGAFMKTFPRARELAATMVDVGRAVGKRVSALVTDMDQPLGVAAGNACEVAESIEVLRGGGPPDLVEITFALGAEMLRVAGVAASTGEGRERLQGAIASGAAMERFRRCIELQGGDPRVCDDPGRLPQPLGRLEVRAPASGVIEAIDTERAGVAALLLGAGRSRKEESVDPRVGLLVHKRRGQAVQAGEPLVTLLHAGRGLEAAQAEALAAWRIGERPPAEPPLVQDTLRNWE